MLACHPNRPDQHWSSKHGWQASYHTGLRAAGKCPACISGHDVVVHWCKAATEFFLLGEEAPSYDLFIFNQFQEKNIALLYILSILHPATAQSYIKSDARNKNPGCMHVCVCVYVSLLNHISSNRLEITGRLVWLTVCLLHVCDWFSRSPFTYCCPYHNRILREVGGTLEAGHTPSECFLSCNR